MTFDDQTELHINNEATSRMCAQIRTMSQRCTDPHVCRYLDAAASALATASDAMDDALHVAEHGFDPELGDRFPAQK